MRGRFPVRTWSEHSYPSHGPDCSSRRQIRSTPTPYQWQRSGASSCTSSTAALQGGCISRASSTPQASQLDHQANLATKQTFVVWALDNTDPEALSPCTEQVERIKRLVSQGVLNAWRSFGRVPGRSSQFWAVRRLSDVVPTYGPLSGPIRIRDAGQEHEADTVKHTV